MRKAYDQKTGGALCPRPPILSSPHCIDRLAAGVPACPDSWFTAAERAEVFAAVIRGTCNGSAGRPSYGSVTAT